MTTTNTRNRFDFHELSTTTEWVDAYWGLGYLIISNVFDEDEIAAMRQRFDRWYSEGMRHPSTFRHQNKVIWVAEDEQIGRYVRGMQWPSYEDHVLDGVRTDQRMLQIVEPLIGKDLKQIINQLHWKTPGAGVTWGLHRDERSRKPDEAFRDLASSYVQTGIAVDRHWADNGAMKILPYSHTMERDRELDRGAGGHQKTGEDRYAAAGYDMDQLIDVEMNPGDVALWGPYTIHGGGINVTADNYRRLYINGYVIGENCDRGEWTFRDGQPVPLDLANPALVQFDHSEHKEAFYPGKDSAAAKVSD